MSISCPAATRDHSSPFSAGRALAWALVLASACPALGQVAEMPAEAAPIAASEWWTWSQLTGDWWGLRTDLAAKGLTFGVEWTQITQSIVDGGTNRVWAYGGSLDYSITLDLEKAELVPGGSVSFLAETRYGSSVNTDAGVFTPVNTDGYYPLTATPNATVPFTITELTYTQNIGEQFSVTFGKMITVDGDPTEFAGGRGRTQFFNSNFIYNAVTSQTGPYSTLGVAATWQPVAEFGLTGMIFNTLDSSTTTGFQNLGDGVTALLEADVQYQLGILPGGFNAGAMYAFDQSFLQINAGTPDLSPVSGSIPTVDNAWSIYAGGWQYLYTPAAPADTVDPSDGRADIEGIGVFTRLGYADPDTNPVAWSGSVGVGGRGLIPGRSGDSYGLAYYYIGTRSRPLFQALGLQDAGQGFEAYYDVALTPATHLTFNVQVVDGGFASADAATILGARLNIQF